MKVGTDLYFPKEWSISEYMVKIFGPCWNNVLVKLGMAPGQQLSYVNISTQVPEHKILAKEEIIFNTPAHQLSFHN